MSLRDAMRTLEEQEYHKTVPLLNWLSIEEMLPQEDVHVLLFLKEELQGTPYLLGQYKAFDKAFWVHAITKEISQDDIKYWAYFINESSFI